MYLPPNRNKESFDLNKIPVRVDRVNITGLLRTYNDYVQRTADNLFKTTNFKELMVEAMGARAYLHELGIFKDIHIKIDVSKGEDATPHGYEVTLDGTELSRVVGTVGTEVGQNEGSLRTELTIPNIFGRGESISLQGSYSSTKANDVTLKFWKPFFHTRFMENRPEISLSLFRNIERMDVSSFQNTKLGFMTDFSVNTKIPIEVTHSFQYEAAVKEFSLLSKSVPFDIRKQCGPKLSSLVRYSAIYDDRDNSVFPTRGHMVKSINEYCGLGGNVAYMSTVLHGETNLSLFAGLVAQVCGRVGVISETKKTINLPLSNLFYCGGPLTLRGFTYGCAGPVIQGTPIGAKTFWTAGLHLWAPLPFSHVFKGLANNFRTHLFYNWGNYNTFSLDNYRSSAGLGIAFKLAERARIEFNYCIPIRRYNEDKVTNGFQFGIGYEFV